MPTCTYCGEEIKKVLRKTYTPVCDKEKCQEEYNKTFHDAMRCLALIGGRVCI